MREKKRIHKKKKFNPMTQTPQLISKCSSNNTHTLTCYKKNRISVPYLLQEKQNFRALLSFSFSSALFRLKYLLLCPGSTSCVLSSSGTLKMRGLAEQACSRRGLKRGGVASLGSRPLQQRHSHSPLGISRESTGGSLEGGRQYAGFSPEQQSRVILRLFIPHQRKMLKSNVVQHHSSNETTLNMGLFPKFQPF